METYSLVPMGWISYPKGRGFFVLGGTDKISRSYILKGERL
ncbi:hypothetical protein HMPREF9163_00097 [Selenomonas sp. oral taxon 138 str. F0429]|nr:hypothetical protein HMPREF9163_00097 [Selenomonas sp. oral taxon 138 str. F0429]